MPVTQRATQSIPKVETLTPTNVVEKLEESNLGRQLSQVEAAWLNDVFAKFKDTPGVKAALARLMQGVKVSDANLPKVATTLAQLRVGATGGTGGTSSTAAIVQKVPSSVSALVVDANAPNGINVQIAREGSRAADTSHLQRGGDLFKGILQLNVGEMLAGAGRPELQPLVDALKGGLVIETPHNQMQVEPGVMGNPVLFYGSDYKEVADVLHAVDQETPGVFHKAMIHYDASHVVGGPEAFFESNPVVMGSTHGGVLVPVIDDNGNKNIAWIDYPTDYGRLPTGGDNPYAARLGVDSLANMTFDAPLPADWKERIHKYADWQRTMGVLSMITVPFASGDDRSWNSDYHFNLLEVSSAAKASELLSLVSSPNAPETQQKAPLYSQYCREGAETMTNAREATFKTLTPQAQASLLEMDAIVKAAGGDQPAKARLGWEALHAAGKISDDQLSTLESTHCIHIPFKVPTDLEPVSTYKPRGVELDPNKPGFGLSAKPLHMGGLLGGVLETNFNRERTSAAISKQLGEVVAAAAQTSGPQAAGQLLGMAAGVAGLDPQLAVDPSQHAKIIEAFGDKMHTELVVGILNNPKIQGTIKKSIRYDLMDTASKTKVDKLITAYVDLAKGGTRMSEEDFRKAQRNLDAKAAATTITYGPPINRSDALMVFVAPQYDLFVAQGAGGASKPGYAPIAELLPDAWRA